MIVYDSHICIFIKRDSLKTPSTENKNVNKEKYVNKETIVFLQITKHFNKVDSPLAIPVTFSCGVQTAIFNVLVNVQFQLAERVIWRKEIQPAVHYKCNLYCNKTIYNYIAAHCCNFL